MTPDRPRTPPRQRATLVNSRSRETRLALTRAAVRLWGEGDFDEAYEASTAADIAAAAGVSKGTFYFHFANKAEILREMSAVAVQSMIDEVADGIGQDVPLLALSAQVMSTMAGRVARGPRAAAVRAGSLGFLARAGEVSLEGPRLGVAFAALVRYGQDRGELNSQIDAEEGAAMLTAVTMEAIIRWGQTPDRPASWLDRTLRDRAAVVLRGIGPG